MMVNEKTIPISILDSIGICINSTEKKMTFVKVVKLTTWLLISLCISLLLPAFAQKTVLMDEQEPFNLSTVKTEKQLIHALQNYYVALCYHDVRDYVAQYSDPDRYAFSTAELARQFEWMATNGYHPVSLQQIIEADKGGKPLPENAILLSFDDGYRSFYTHIYPLLKAYRYPAVFALVTNWVDLPKNKNIDVGHAKLTHKDFLTWQQVTEMAKSGLIEFSSHTHDMHKGVIANEQGNIEPAAVIPQYSPKEKRYETNEQYKQRILADLKKSSDLIYRYTGKRPRSITWPYGRFTQMGNDIAKSLGMGFSFTLINQSANHVSEREKVQRILLGKNVPIADFIYQVVEKQKNILHKKDQQLDYYQKTPEPQRIVKVDLDYIYDKDPAQVNKNLSKLLDRLQRMRISTVYLQAFADDNANGGAASLYFPNNYLPVKMDLFNRVAWQIKTRADTDVYAWLPVMAFELPDKALQRELQLTPADDKAHIRLDITKPKTRKIIRDIYRSLAFHNEIDGILFHDDAYFRENELTHLTYTEKTDLIIDFTDELTNEFKKYRPKAKTVRNLFANVILHPESEKWFAQNFTKFLNRYDYTAIMAMPHMDKAGNAANTKQWLINLVDQVKTYPKGLEKSIFELQSFDWDKNKRISSEHLAEKMQWLLEEGVLNFGYYPDDYIQGYPKLSVIRPKFSLATTPFKK